MKSTIYEYMKEEKKVSADGEGEAENDSETAPQDVTHFNTAAVPAFLRGSVSPDATAYRTVNNALVIPRTTLMILNFNCNSSSFVLLCM